MRYILTSADETDDNNWTVETDVWTSGTGGALEYTISPLDHSNSYDVQVRAENDDGTSGWSDSVAGITQLNQGPVFTSISAVSVSENSTGTIVTVTATDADNEDTITGYAIVDEADGSQFSIVSSTGVLSFRAAPNYESPTDVEVTAPANDAKNNEYIVVVAATSGTNERALTARQTLTVTVSDVNEAPVFSSNDEFDVAENTTQVGSVEAEDVDGADSITGYGITGGADQAKFEITNAGVLSFTTAPDFENPTDVLSTTPPNAAGNNEYIVEVTATGGADNRAMTAVQTITVTVTDENEPPSIPDVNLRAVIAKILDKTSGEPITSEDMANLTHLDAPNKAIRDLTGLEHATNLQRLNLGYDWTTEGQKANSNAISSIAPLGELTHLKWVNLDGNTISDIAPVADLAPLTLHLRSNTISDIAPLVANTGLDEGDWVVLNDNPLSATSRNTHIPALSTRSVNVRLGDNLTLPASSPAFSPHPVRDYAITLPITDSFSGDRTTQLLPRTASFPDSVTHVQYDAGTITVPTGTSALNFSGTKNKSYAATFTATANINVTNATAVNIVTSGNTEDLMLVNKGSIQVSEHGLGLRTQSRHTGDTYSANYGTITINNSTNKTVRSIASQINKNAAPHDDTHSAESINLSGGSIVNTGDEGRQDGLFVECGGQLARSINYGTVNVAGEDSRAVAAQTLWGAAQTHNTGSITTSGSGGSDGIHSETCAAYLVGEGCHRVQDEIKTRRNTHAAGPAYARNYNTGNIQTSGKRSHGIAVIVKKAGRAYGINEGTVSTTGDKSSGIFAYGHRVKGFETNSFSVLLNNHPTAEYNFLRFSPAPIGEIRLTYAANTSQITTSGEDSHGLRAHHGLGGKVEIANSGRIKTTGDRAHGIYAQAYGRDIVIDERHRVYSAGDVVINNSGVIVVSGSSTVGILAESKNLLNTGRTANSGDIEIVLDGTIIASGDNGIGISAETEEGDITIVVTGFIRAKNVGIRVQTTGEVLINLIGTVDAPTLWETFGDNTPSQITVNTPSQITVSE